MGLPIAPDWNLLLAATAATAVNFFTPGPSNSLCAAMGATHGFRRTLPFAFGVTVGCFLLLAVAGMGLGGVLRAYPQLRQFAQVAGALFLAYLAYRIITAPLKNNDDKEDNVLGFFRGVALQWVNPKAISFMVSLVSLYVRPQALATDLSVLLLALLIIALSSSATWAFAGAAIRHHLNTPRRLRLFNALMGGLLLLAAADSFRH